ncbi:MAG: VCBS repeat-containing protein [Verrucomicrobiota bacterium]|nr:VCBS repeat-containing protein [Verrucomicrobiota bacterium]
MVSCTNTPLNHGFLACLWACAVASVGVLGQSLQWQDLPGGRFAELKPTMKEDSGFERLDAGEAGIDFIHALAEEVFDLNHNLANGSGVALGDVNGDDLCDVFFTSHTGFCRLYLNRGDWVFEDHTQACGIQLNKALATGVLLEDIDGDRDLDCLVGLNGVGVGLWLNNGKGVFEHATPKAFLSRSGPHSLAMADINGDTRMDLFVANYGENTMRSGAAISVKTVRGRQVVTGRWRNRIKIIGGQLVEQGEPNRLYIQTPTGNFEGASWTDGRFEAANGMPLKDDLWDMSLSARFVDLNLDGKPDIYVCNDFQAGDRVWINQGNGRFRAPSPEMMRLTSHNSMCFDMADINRDGLMDLMTVDMLSRDHFLRMTQMAIMSPDPAHLGAMDQVGQQVRRNALLVNRGDGSYAELARYAGVEAADWAWVVAFIDVDMDGWEDIVIANGHLMDTQDMDTFEKRNGMSANARNKNVIPYPALNTPNVAFRNNGDLTFEPMGEAWGFRHTAVSNGLAMADLDNDGDLDVVINTLNGPPLLYRNKASSPRVAVRLRGRGGNSSGIGARIELLNMPRPMVKEMSAGGRYLSDDQNVITFAMPPDGKVHGIRVTWPDGTVSTMDEVLPGRLYELDAFHARAADKEVSPQGVVDPSSRPWFERVASPHTFSDDAERPDWEWQPALHQSLDSRRLRAVMHTDASGSRDVWTPMPSEAPAKSPGAAAAQTATTRHEAFAWLDAAWKAHLQFLPAGAQSSSVSSPIRRPAPFAMADIDRDGRLDVFVGMPPMPGTYPVAGGSQLYMGTSNGLVPALRQEAWSHVGNVQDLVFVDLDQDTWADLLVASAWAPLRVFRNMKGRLVEETEAWGLSSYHGRWKDLAVFDADNDGDMDVAAANWGRNTRYQSFLQHPIRLYYGDANRDGIQETLEAWHDAKTQRWLPLDGLARQENIFPGIRRVYPTHRAFAEVGMDDFLEAMGMPSQFLEVNTLDSMLFLNQGKRFEGNPLPDRVQWSTANNIQATDFNLDGNMDLFIAQNQEENPPHIGNINAGTGLLLQGHGDASFSRVDMPGITLHGMQYAAWSGDANGDARPDLWVQTRHEVTLYQGLQAHPGWRLLLHQESRTGPPAGTLFRLIGHRKHPLHMLQLDDGYEGTSSFSTLLPQPAKGEKLWIRWPDGEEQLIALPDRLLKVVTVTQGEAFRPEP